MDEAPPRLTYAEALQRIREEHTPTGNLINPYYGVVYCDTDEEWFPCATWLVLELACIVVKEDS